MDLPCSQISLPVICIVEDELESYSSFSIFDRQLPISSRCMWAIWRGESQFLNDREDAIMLFEQFVDDDGTQYDDLSFG